LINVEPTHTPGAAIVCAESSTVVAKFDDGKTLIETIDDFLTVDPGRGRPIGDR
jgi:hypothetical protein